MSAATVKENPDFEAVIGLETHAELATRSKMFCSCMVVDATQSEPNIAVCPVCAGMPGVLPVVNQRAIEYALKVACALECEIAPQSFFARKNYFYPDLPKGYQISQYEQPLARHGRLSISTSGGERQVRIRRVHLEEDTGKLTHIAKPGESYSLVDLNRAGVPLLEIVTEPDMRSAEEVRQFAMALRSLLRYLGVSSGDMQKGVLRIEPNISVRLQGSSQMGTRTEIKNLNSFRALERSVAYEIQRQIEIIKRGEAVHQETRGWDDSREVTVLQRRKEAEDDYRYFPEPDLPPLVVEKALLDRIQADLPELPAVKIRRFQEQYGLNDYDVGVLSAEPAAAEYFEKVAAAVPEISPKIISNWISGELFGVLNQAGESMDRLQLPAGEFAALLRMLDMGEINQNSARSVLGEMFAGGRTAREIVSERGLSQLTDQSEIAAFVRQVLVANPEQVAAYRHGKTTLEKWFFGQVMRLSKGQANPQLVQQELSRQLEAIKDQ